MVPPPPPPPAWRCLLTSSWIFISRCFYFSWGQKYFGKTLFLQRFILQKILDRIWVVRTSNCLSHLLLWRTIHVCFFYNKNDISGPALLPLLKMPSPVLVQDKHAFIIHTHWHNKHEEGYFFCFTSYETPCQVSVINIFVFVRLYLKYLTYSKMQCPCWNVYSIVVISDI